MLRELHLELVDERNFVCAAASRLEPLRPSFGDADADGRVRGCHEEVVAPRSEAGSDQE
jgi:hypothetical protein